jgi:hypothetical protein
MRRIIPSVLSLAVAGLFLAVAGSGCGGSGVEEGVPANVDLTKDYTPQVNMPGMSPKIQRETAKKSPNPPPQ